MSVEGVKSNIQANVSTLADAQVARPATQSPVGKSAPAGPNTTGDRVSLTPEAALLKEVEKRLADIPVVDAQRVEKIRSDIAQGAYNIDPTRVANKLIDFEKLFTNNGK